LAQRHRRGAAKSAEKTIHDDRETADALKDLLMARGKINEIKKRRKTDAFETARNAKQALSASDHEGCLACCTRWSARSRRSQPEHAGRLTSGSRRALPYAAALPEGVVPLLHRLAHAADAPRQHAMM
jgi:hypothetical protein